jgi:hypothetical protein
MPRTRVEDCREFVGRQAEVLDRLALTCAERNIAELLTRMAAEFRKVALGTELKMRRPR